MVRSHPTKPLSQHIAEVKQATLWILERHSRASVLNSECFRYWADRVCQLHDLGKGSAAFQRYIADPEGFSDDPKTKAHTPLSLVLSALLLEDEQQELTVAWGVMQAVLCHHGYLRTRDALMGALDSDLYAPILTQQLNTLDVRALAEATEESLSEFCIDEGSRDQALDFVEACVLSLESLEYDLSDEGILQQAVDARIWCQLLFSVLLEADKALLAIPDEHRYQQEHTSTFALRDVDQFVEGAPAHPINHLRQEARSLVLDALQGALREGSGQRFFSLCLPTGLGKTLTAASWAFSLRESVAPRSKVIVVMPFLSVIDQTEAVYRMVLGMHIQGSDIMASHSLSTRSYDAEADGNTASFFLDTWRSNLILTTYDQLLMSLMSPKGKHQMRMHQLCDAILIFDELQSVPCQLWRPFEALLHSLCVQGNSYALVMSATLPEIFKTARPLLDMGQIQHFFGQFQRYRLRLDCWELRSLGEFIEEVVESICTGLWAGRRVLIALNTRKSARAVRDAIEAVCGVAPHFITADVTPAERLGLIEELKLGRPCVVVATQCIEAGVDLDFDYMIRDFAPLDSLIQVAGRCNRNQRRGRCDVRIVRLFDGATKCPFYKLIYDAIHTNATFSILQGHSEILEEDILALGQAYFRELERQKDTGEALLRDYVAWKEHPDVRELLRGEQHAQHSFVVLDPLEREQRVLLEELETLESDPESFGDRWAQRRALRRLASSLSKYTVSVYAKGEFEPSEIAEQRAGAFWLLSLCYYEKGRGIILPESAERACLLV